MEAKPHQEYLVFLPSALIESEYIGDLWGYYHPQTGIFNVLAWDDASKSIFSSHFLEKIGTIEYKNHSDNAVSTPNLLGSRSSGEIHFTYNGKPCKVDAYNTLQNIFSRNSGILETDWMLNKTAIIAGCGSVGSLVALELARSGVGTFILIDNDILAYHNICRHQCGVRDVGKFKVQALQERLIEINPSAKVKTFVDILENLPKDVFDKYCTQNTILISCADNREADQYASQISVLYNIPFVSIGFWERAFAGEIFYFIPSENMPCYECALGESSVSGKVSTNRRVYTNEEDLRNVNFEPGISVDINFVTTVAIKLILDLLNRGNEKYTPRVINYLTQFTLVCNTNDTRIGGEMAEIFAHPLQITNSIKVQFGNQCPPCKYH